MTESSGPLTQRRRSSVAYDPARNIFKEIPLASPAEDEVTVTEAMTSSSPNQVPASNDEGKKRKWSSSPGRGHHAIRVNNEGAQDDATNKRRPSPLPELPAQNGSRIPAAAKTLSDLPRVPRRPQEGGTSSPNSRPSAYSRRPDTVNNNANDHNRRGQDSREQINGRNRSRDADREHNGNRDRQRSADRHYGGSRDRSREANRHHEGNRYRPRESNRPQRNERDSNRDRDYDKRPNGLPRRSHSPSETTRSLYRRRSPPRPRERERSPSPIRRSPPRSPVARPGGAKGRGRNVLAEQQRLAAERERQAATIQTQTNRGVQDMSNQFYNARPEWVKEYGRDWRNKDSKIAGLRKYNNWVKSSLIQKFSAEEKAEEEDLGWGEEVKQPEAQKPLLVLDVGCGKGGDLGKWDKAPQPVGLVVGLDPADVSIQQAEARYVEMKRRRRPVFAGHFHTKDCFGEWIGDIPIIRQIGIDQNAGNGVISKFSGGGFDIVSMMFSMHYAFESEEKTRMMLRNVAGSLKKGGRFLGVVPNSDFLADQLKKWYANKPEKQQDQPASQTTGTNGAGDSTNQEDEEEGDAPSWGNSIYKIRFPPKPHPTAPASNLRDGNFRPPYSWKYTFWMAEAVDVPEFVVPWEAFRAIAEGFNLEQRYRKPFLAMWGEQKDDPAMKDLASRMGVLDNRSGELMLSDEEKEAISLYHAFCFVKV